MSMILSNFWNILMPVSAVIDTIDTNCNFYQELEKEKLYYIFNKGYPQNYSAGSSCQWTAKSPPNSRIFLSCDDITMPKSTNCKHDRLEISSSGRNNLSESHTYCGEGAFSLVTQESTLDVVLKTSKKSQGGRFLCSVTAIGVEGQQDNGFESLLVQPSCQCGWKNDRRIIGGHDTSVNEYPAMAGLIDDTRRVYCGATIISNRYVITAAHCVQNKDAKSLLILVGDHDVTTGTDTAFSAIYRVQAYEMWDYYDSSTLQGDIALIQVDKINFNENVGPICLPFRYTFNKFEGETVTVLGWGQLSFSGPNSNILQEVDLEVISNSECEESASENIISSEICTFRSGKDSCQSDSGGPLFWQNQESRRLFLVGIVSHGRGCASANPAINTRVTSFLEWIQRRTGHFGSSYIAIVLLIILFRTSKVTSQNCDYYMELVVGQEYYIYNPTYPNNYSQNTNCIWNLRTAAGSNVYVSCSINLPLSRDCYGDKVVVSPTGNSLFVDAFPYCGLRTFSLYSQETDLALGLYTTRNTRGGKLICTATAIKSSDPNSELSRQVANISRSCDCGWKQMNRIVGGVETGVHEFPYMAALIYEERLLCGASIISNRFVLTAGHCMLRRDTREFYLLVGDHNIKTGEDTPNSAIYKVSAYEIYPDYNALTYKNDIALVQTATEILFSAEIGPVCLPFRYTYENFDGQSVTVLGWGQLQFSGQLSDTLQKTDLNILSSESCNTMVDEELTNGDMCTYSEESHDSCQNDSGGPVLWYDHRAQRYQLLGIISRGIGCGAATPGINTRVSEYLKWIINRTNANFCIK